MIAAIFLITAVIAVLIYLSTRGGHGYSVNGKGIPGFLYFILMIILAIVYIGLIS